MDIATHPTRVPVFRLIAIGMAVAFAYLLLTLVLGFGSGDARADDGDRGGLLGGVTDVVDSTVGGVTDAVQSTTQAVTTTVQQVVQTAPPPVQPVVEPVVSTVASTVEAVVQPVAEVAASGVVGDVVQPVVDVVNEVPVVGEVTQAIGLDEAVTDVAGTADAAVDDVVTTVRDTATTLGAGRPPLVVIPDLEPPIGAPALIAADGFAQAADAVLTRLTAAAAPLPAWAAAAVWDAYSHALPVLTRIASTGTAAAGLVSTGAQVGGILSSAFVLGACAPGGSSPMGSNGAGPGALALAAFAPLVAYRAWMRRNGWNDDVAPPAPTYDTDIAPD